jgi:hypothetical protein
LLHLVQIKMWNSWWQKKGAAMAGEDVDC